MKNKYELMMDSMYWWGIPTLFRCDHNTNINDCDIALAGVPHSSGNGTTERDQHLGPRAVRNVSAGLRRVHLDFGINPWEKKKIFDIGDVPLPSANNNEKCIEDITNFLLIRGPHAWLGHGWLGCSRDYHVPKEFNYDYGVPTGLCKETGKNSGIFTRDWTKAIVQMDCNTWTPTITMKKE